MFCYQSNFSNPTLPVDEAQFYALVRAQQWHDIIDRFRQSGDASLKRKLPAFIFQATFSPTTSKAGRAGAWRKQAATQLTGLVVMDVDHVDHPLTLYQGWIDKGLDLKALGIVLIYITPSGKGVKIVFKARTDWGNLIDNQHQMAQLLGVEVDESCKDASRMSFICKESDILYIDKELFTYENQAFAERYTALYRDGHSQATRDHSATEIRTDSATEKVLKSCSPLQEEFNGMPVSEIIDKWMQGVNLANNRHNTLVDLASHLRYVIGKNPTKITEVVMTLPWVQDLAKEGEDVAGTVRSVMDFKYHEYMPKKLREAVAATSQLEDDNMARQLWAWGEEIEALSVYYPALKDVCKGLKRNQYPAALFVAGGLMMTLMTRCTYRFYHRPEELRRLNNSTFIIGDPASGKSFATRLYKLLAAPIIAADQTGKDAINAYREQMRTKGANKEKPKKPKVVVRIHPARTSNAQFIQDMVNSVEEVDGRPMQLHMLTFDTELDNTVSVQRGGSWIDKMSLELKAFHNEEDGQAYSNNDSVLQDFFVTWNFIYTGTPIALKKKVNEQNFGSGLATRLTCIPLPATNFQMLTRESTIDYDSDERLKEWAKKLDRTKGELSVQRLVDELYDWTARRMADAADNQSRADEMLLKRCAYHGLNFAAPFIVMRHWGELHQEGEFWCGTFNTDDIDWRLAELIVNIQYACQRHYFGRMAESYFDNKQRDASVNIQRRGRTIESFNRLPDEFTADDVMRCFELQNENAARSRMSRLQSDHLIEKVSDGRSNSQGRAVYRKTGTVML
ncbi:BT4734/BF3469 family protein [Prevotella sp. P6B1]|uniref:BT4734/BF3469 family protein n=1 Tax=Prevotella sp. P6B1 TaxID=1410613 RepID=UPI00051AF2F7|nr:BT4734/BF3469 family protein [Prevotella sp. P6B1]